MGQYLDIRRFLFQTTLGSGAEGGFPPLTTDENRGAASRIPAPAFATNRGRDADKVVDPGGGVLEPVAGLSLVLETVLLGLAFDARNVLLTETALNVAGFLAEDAVRPWPLSPSFFAQSVREASVSDPPLTLTSAELSCSSTLVMRLFEMSSIVVARLPFTVGGSRAAWWAWSAYDNKKAMCVSFLLAL